MKRYRGWSSKQRSVYPGGVWDLAQWHMESILVHWPGSSLKHILLGFYEDLITVTTDWSFLPFLIIQSPAPLPSWKAEGVERFIQSANPLITWSPPQANSPILRLPACYVTSVVSDSLQLYDCSPPGSSVHRTLQARILEWVGIAFSRGSSWPRYQTRVSCVLQWQVGSLPLVPPVS